MRRASPNFATCQNRLCDYYALTEGKRVIKNGRNGKGHQIFRCLHCGKTFVETRGGPGYRKRLEVKAIRNIYGMALLRKGDREIEKITAHHRDTVGRLILDLSEETIAATGYLSVVMNYSKEEVGELLRISSERRLRRHKAGASPERER